MFIYLFVGALFDATQSYTTSFAAAAGCFVLSSLVLWLEIPANSYVKRKESEKEREERRAAEEEKGENHHELLVQEMIEMA